MDYKKIYEKCYLIRRFEEEVEKEFEKGIMRGTTHGCIGQEIIPVIVFDNIENDVDYITGTHRSHGQILAYTDDDYKLIAEMTGKYDGFNCGMGGSQHIKINKYITNGVTGGMASVAMGMAYSLKVNSKRGIVIAFVGDGGFHEGYFLETMNLAGTFGVPILYILENNKYAMSTKTQNYVSGKISDKVKANGIKYFFCNARKVEELNQIIKDAQKYVREERKPALVEIDTFRLCGHSKSDQREYMSDKEKQENINNDPMKIIRSKICNKEVTEIEKQINKRIESSFKKAQECKEIGIEEYKRILS